MKTDAKLKQSYKRVCKPDSHFWAFWRPGDLDHNSEVKVEIRLNLPDGDELKVQRVEGWAIAHRKTGMLFLRSVQRIDKRGVKSLFFDALRIANEQGWQFHSWQHAPHLSDWVA